MLTRLRHWIGALLRRDRTEGELAREMASHLAMATAQYEASGLDSTEARRRAMIDFGGVERFKESVRDERGTRPLQDFLTDLRLSWRSLLHRPAFLVTTMLTLGIGIGATMAVYSWANWILLRPVPGIRAPEEIVGITFSKSAGSSTGISYPNLRDFRDQLTSVAGLAGSTDASLQFGAEGVPPINLQGVVVTGDYFGVLGVRAQRGRLFSPDELAPDAVARSAVISDRLWRDQFGGAAGVLGRRLRLNAEEYEVVGVAAPAFRGTTRGKEIDVWLPLATLPLLRHAPALDPRERRPRVVQTLVARLRPGVSATMATDDLRRAAQSMVAAWPGDDDNAIYAEYLPTINTDIGTSALARPGMESATTVLGVIVALVMLIALANTANLVLLRGTGRRGELALRRAIGATGGRLLRQHLTEGFLLAMLGACTGLLIALALSRLFQGAGGAYPVFERLELDRRVMGFTVLLTFVSGVLIGCVPALVSHRRELMRHLKDSGRSAPARARTRAVLTVVQLAASMTLVVCAFLLTATLRHFARIDVGFEPDQLLVFGTQTEAQGYTPQRLQQLQRDLVARAGVQPGIVSAAVSSTIPFGGGSFMTDVRLPTDSGKTWPARAQVLTISPGYFATMEIRLEGGRTFSEEEYQREAGDLVVIGRNTAMTLFGTDRVLGRQIVQRNGREPITQTIIGVAGEVRSSRADLQGEPAHVIYQVSPVAGVRSFSLVVRSSISGREAIARITGTLAALDPDLPFYRSEPIDAAVARSLGTVRLFTSLIGVLATLAALLAAIGLYSVMAFGVAERTREIGIRMALGSSESGIVRLVLRKSGVLIVTGLLLGAGMATFASKLLDAQLFGVTRLDPLVYGTAGLVALAIGAAASALPARSATQVTPVRALKAE